MSQRAFICALLAGGALLCGCGSSSSSSSNSADTTFKRAFLVQVRGLRSVGTRLSAARASAPKDSDAKIHRVFAGLARDTGPVLAGLATLNPTPRYRPDLQALRHSLTLAQQDLRAVAHAAAVHRAAAFKAAIGRLDADSSAVKAADDRLSLLVASG